MKKIYYLLLLVCPILWSACDSEEKLTPGEPLSFYDFPQGDAAYDHEFVDFYKKYDTQVLYRFKEMDFRWNVTSYLPFYAEQPEEKNIQQAWDFINQYCFSIWSEDFLKQCLPSRIFLASRVYSLKINTVWEGNTSRQDTTEVPKNTIYGLSHITFGRTDGTLNTLSAAEKKELIGDMAFALIGYAAYRDNIEVPQEFVALHNKWKSGNNEYQASWGYNGCGFLEYYANIDAAYDFGLYVKYLVMNSKEEFEKKYLDPSFDSGGENDPVTGQLVPQKRIYQKYQIVVNYFLNTLHIDLHAIGNKISQLQ